MNGFRAIRERMFNRFPYCILLMGIFICSSGVYAVPADEIDWGWSTPPAFPNEAYGPRTDVNPDLIGDNHLFDVWAPDGDGPYPVMIYAHSSHGVSQAELSGLDAIMLRAIEQEKIEGCSFLVAHKGKTIYKKAHGAFKTDEQVLLASVSKPFAASVLMVLAEQGKLQLDDPVEKYLPEFKGKRVEGSQSPARPMTIRHLLSHMAGFWGNKKITPEKLALIRNPEQTLKESVRAPRSTILFASREANGSTPESGIAWRVVSRKRRLATSRSRRSRRTPCFARWV